MEQVQCARRGHSLDLNLSRLPTFSQGQNNDLQRSQLCPKTAGSKSSVKTTWKSESRWLQLVWGQFPGGYGMLANCYPTQKAGRRTQEGKMRPCLTSWHNQDTLKRESLECEAPGLYPKLQQECDWGLVWR